MRQLRRNKRPIYICKRAEQEGYEVFDKPVSLLINLAPVNDKTLIGITGDDKNTYLQGTIDKIDRVYYNEHDRLYVNNRAPLKHDILCRHADYAVDSIKDYLNHSVVILRRLSGE